MSSAPISSISVAARQRARGRVNKPLRPRARRPSRLPVILSPVEIGAFFEHIPSLKYRAALMSCYGAGLLTCEAVSLKITDIDSQRMLVRSKAKVKKIAIPCYRRGWAPPNRPENRCS